MLAVLGCITLQACRSVYTTVAISWLSAIFKMADCAFTHIGYLLSPEGL